MASWIDYFSLALTVSLIAAAVAAAVFLGNQVHKAINSTKETLKEKGLDVSREGISVHRSSGLANREAYLDATQRGLVKVIGAAHFGSSAEDAQNNASPNTNDTSSTSSSHSNSKSRFGRR